MLDNRNAFNIFSLKIVTKNENTHESNIEAHAPRWYRVE